jgi:putative chitinase
VDCVTQPAYLESPEGAVVSACWFWKSNGCNELAQAGDWLALRKHVNGGTVGIDEVNALIQRALEALGAQ